MAISMILPKEVWVKIFNEFKITSVWKVSTVCKLFSEIFNESEDWKRCAKTMLTDFPAMPQDGWKNWIKNPTPIKFDGGIIDLTLRIIAVYTNDFDEIETVVPPLLKRIFATHIVAICHRGAPMMVWDRDENQKMHYGVGDFSPGDQIRFGDPKYQKFKVIPNQN
jgi:hypothetical protein